MNSELATPAGKRSAKALGITNKKFVEDSWMDSLGRFIDFMCYNIPPGPAFIPMRYYVNFAKGGMFFYLFGMMIYYDNWSLGAYLYLALHGSYGFFWVLKDQAFPDPTFGRLCTFNSVMMPIPIALYPYALPGYWMMSRQCPQEFSNERIFLAVLIYILGLVFVMLTDMQKYLVLREKKGLITHGMMGWSRNMNYVGEMMLYASFNILVQRWEIWFVYSYMWGIVFVLRMLTKDYSLSKKVGWPEYAQRTWMYFPKIYNSALVSLFFYTSLIALSYACYINGGIENFAKLVFVSQPAR